MPESVSTYDFALRGFSVSWNAKRQRWIAERGNTRLTASSKDEIVSKIKGVK